MTDSYAYMKRRIEMMRPLSLIDSKVIHVAGLPDPDAPPLTAVHCPRDPAPLDLSNFPLLSETTVNTERVTTVDAHVLHLEGGWPREVDASDLTEARKYIKKRLERNPDNSDKFTGAVRRLIESVEPLLQRNGEINMFEEYFNGEEAEERVEPLALRTLKLFRRGKGGKTPVSSLSWHPEGPQFLAASYSALSFQQRNSSVAEAAVWDVAAPNEPVETMTPPFPISKLAYNHKNPEQIAFGCVTGAVGLWDIKANRHRPALVFPVEVTHYEAVVDLLWLSSKSGNEFVTCSIDGHVKWWDTRQSDTPTDVLKIAETAGSGSPELVLGATALEYVADYGPKYLIGAESGAVLLATKKPKKAVEINFANCYGIDGIGRHLGPITRVQRNPFFPRFFLSVGDWSVNVWEDDLKTPIMYSRYHTSLLADGAWSPARPGVFFVARKDGWLDVWDLYFRQNRVALSHRVTPNPLTCLRFNVAIAAPQGGPPPTDTGRFCAVGDAAETITLIELCSALHRPATDERAVLGEIFEREKGREEICKKQRLEKAKQRERQKAERPRVVEDASGHFDVKKLAERFTAVVAERKHALGDIFIPEVETPDSANDEAQAESGSVSRGQEDTQSDVYELREESRQNTEI